MISLSVEEVGQWLRAEGLDVFVLQFADDEVRRWELRLGFVCESTDTQGGGGVQLGGEWE